MHALRLDAPTLFLDGVQGAAAAEVLAQAVGVPIAQVGRLRAQAPIKPIPMALALPDEAA